MTARQTRQVVSQSYLAVHDTLPSSVCSPMSQFVIIRVFLFSPQGTTALYTFLKEHPLVLVNKNSPEHYEEVQFFSNETLYNYGVEW